jgi:hypothetical protein
LAPQSNDQTKEPSLERLDSSVTSVEADSLPFYSQAARFVINVASEIDEDELRQLRNRPDLRPESLIYEVNAIRMLAFMMQPGERLTFNLKSEQSKVRLAVYPDSKAIRLKAALKVANMSPRQTRSKKLVFTNSSKEPYEMVLFVYGLHGYSYQLNWESKLKK